MKPEGTILSLQPHSTGKSNKVGKSAAPILGIVETDENDSPDTIPDLSLLPGDVVASFWLLSFQAGRSMRELVQEAMIDHTADFVQPLRMRKSA